MMTASPRMAEDRDRPKLKTPPSGVAAQIARPMSPRGRSQHDLPRPTPADMPDDDWHTPIGMPIMEELALRTQRTQHETTKALVVSQDTLDRVDLVRGELKGDLNLLATRVDTITRLLLEDRQERKDRLHLRTKAESAQIAISRGTALSQITVGQTREITELKQGALTKETQLKILYRGFYFVCTAALAILTYLLGRG